jgi:hypothetical protein
MQSLKLYVVKYWVPFPSSEYGGIEGYVAENRAQLKEMILETVDDYYAKNYPNYEALIDKVVADAQVFVLQDTMTTGQVFEFST